jgi:GxxExxY protein
MKHERLTGAVIAAAYEVHNDLGFGFAEKVYENALACELRERGIAFEQQVPLQVHYKGTLVGDYVADLIVDGRVIVETKAVKHLDPAHEVQVVNYLKATGTEIGLLVNFGQKVDVKRKILDRT